MAEPSSLLPRSSAGHRQAFAARWAVTALFCLSFEFACARDPAPKKQDDSNGGGGAVGAHSGGGEAGAPPTPSGGASAGTAGAAGAVGTDSDCVAQVAGLRVYTAWDGLGYAPYALSDCSLAYVTPEGELRLRDLENGGERVLEVKEFAPRRPSLSADVVTWEATIEGKSSVRVFHDGSVSTLGGSFDHAGEPRAGRGVVVFTAWAEQSSSSDTDILSYDAARHALSTALGGAGQQRFPDVSSEYVVASDFAEDSRGYFDEAGSVADLFVLDRSAGSVFHRTRPGKQAFAMLGSDGALAYLDWGAVHPEPKFSEFALHLGRVAAAPEQDVLVRNIRTDPSYVRPSLRGEFVDFIDSTTGSALLYRVRVATPTQALATVLDVTTPLGPIAAPGLTLFGARVGAAVELRVVPRLQQN